MRPQEEDLFKKRRANRRLSRYRLMQESRLSTLEERRGVSYCENISIDLCGRAKRGDYEPSLEQIGRTGGKEASP